MNAFAKGFLAGTALGAATGGIVLWLYGKKVEKSWKEVETALEDTIDKFYNVSMDEDGDYVVEARLDIDDIIENAEANKVNPVKFPTTSAKRGHVDYTKPDISQFKEDGMLDAVKNTIAETAMDEIANVTVLTAEEFTDAVEPMDERRKTITFFENSNVFADEEYKAVSPAKFGTAAAEMMRGDADELYLHNESTDMYYEILRDQDLTIGEARREFLDGDIG